MKILWLSWRDIKNPDAGGAEKVAVETASRFVRDGSSVTIFTSTYRGATPQELIRGVKIIRRGNRLTCRFHAFLYYLKNRKTIDLVIDEINTIPFFAPLYAKKETIALIHQLAREYWFTQTVWPINLLGFLLEPLWLKLYCQRPTLALSDSTKSDLIKLGFTNVKIYQIGLDFKPQFITKKENLILFIGRLTRAKGPQDAIAAFQIIAQKFKDAKLAVVGKGEQKFVKSLKILSRNLYLSEKINLAGYVPDPVKVNFLKRAKIILIPSVREGWNLVATEANATGCVPVAYNVPGLCDSIKNFDNGILVNPNLQNLAQATITILKNEPLRLKLARRGYLWSKQFTWEKTYEDFKSFFLRIRNQ